MQPLLIICNILLILDALALIVAVLMQQGNTQNLGAISGGAETFFGKNKARSYEGKLEMLTKITATAFVLLAITSSALTARISDSANASDTSAYSSSVETEQTEEAQDVTEPDGSLETETADVTPDGDPSQEASPDAGDTP